MIFGTNAGEIAGEIEARGAAAGARSAAVVRHHAMLLLTRIQAHASGRPGPRAQTGDYRRSWGITFDFGHGEFSAAVGTGEPQARRLEWGFDGADALGRVYHQPPFPHVDPAVKETEPGFVDSMGGVIGG